MNLIVFKGDLEEPFLVFDCDEEFTDFCLVPYAEFLEPENEDGHATWRGVFTDEYLWCIKVGIKFVIKDEDSVVCKHQCVCKRVPIKYPDELNDLNPRVEMVPVQLKVQNLEDVVTLPRSHKKVLGTNLNGML